ncbi:MAG: cytochrome C oxidase Cbb3 [Cytophagales bacterium CG12_big_fil_rev_8_21_14_0_65_40_12]|uniref:cytochrome C oxidase Cbb3 n=1 Tax=Roseivirga sp. TaxID=1964215 RepID=UPI000C62AD46|nr:MAG: cytochrome C oxidase Cbb3 [Cytophagales bacterium CG12_big_fil_rev_8_21_14_0_65_40_12]PIW05410.1 MAG: cytochrome C oxidase Cbb3 [Cytophagales bacterium CG17_big_fil_post_rev_8_21_14_2_50_40_13]
MFKYYFEQIHNVEVWPIISLSIFFVFFVGLLIYVARMKKEYISEMADLPLSDNLKTKSDFQPENF